MNSYGNGPQNQIREEHYAGEFLQAPSMSAPQPIPEKPATRRRRASRHEDGQNPTPVTPLQGNPTAEQQPTAGQYTPPEWSQQYAQPVPQPVQPEWQQPYAQQPVPPEWSQPYAQQPVQAEWSQPYAQQPVPPEWSQPYAQQPMQAEWSQSYAQQPVQAEWSQPYAAQPAQQGWSQPYAAQPVPQQGMDNASPAWPADNNAASATMPQPVAPVPPGNDGGNGGWIGGNWWKLVLLGVLVVGLITGGVIGAVNLSQQNALYNEVVWYNDRFCEGVYVDGIHLGGMTQQEAIAAVNAHAQERLASWNVNLTYGGRLVRQITATDLGMTVNVHDALSEAWQYGHDSNSVSERKAAMDALLVTPYYGYTAMPSGDTSAVDRILNMLAAPVYRMPQDATVTFDPEAHSYPFEYTPEVYGTFLDVEPIKKQIYGMVDNMESGSIELQPQSIAPRVTEADLRRMCTLRGTATTEISSGSTPERTANIQRAFQLIDGTVLKPGESFSFNGIVGARSEKNGFHKAIEYAYGNERMGYGGGVCQASTTVYLAAVRADVSITHREPHSDKVNYTEYGLDATVNIDGKKIDLTFKNTTASNVYVMAYLERKNNHWICRVDIYGEALPDGVTYDLIAETVEVLPAPVDPEYVEDEDGTHVVYIDDAPVVKRKASDGYVVETFKVKYVNGKEVERTYVARDTYKAKSQQLWVGVQERDIWGQ